ncbi:MAG: protease inhibitor I42 family protein [Chloroflexota bacterium]
MSCQWFGKSVVVCSIILLVAALSGCSSQEVSLGAKDNGGQVTLEQGQILAISLESNPTTGYGWQALEMDAAVLRQSGEAEYKQSPGSEGLVGAGGVETLRFEALAAGQTTLTLGYMRPWESVPPVETFTLQVTVQ